MVNACPSLPPTPPTLWLRSPAAQNQGQALVLGTSP
jgi:hypothetical protein